MSWASLRRFWPLPWVGGLLAVVCGLGSLSAQIPFDPEAPANNGPEVFRAVPREMSLALASAQKAVAEGRGQDAIELLSAIINPEDVEFSRLKPEEAQQDYFELGEDERETDPDKKKKPILLSVKMRAQRMLGGLPEKIRDLYQLKFGATAELRLREAIASGDLQELQGVGRRYFHTKAGYDATFLAGRLQLERGQPLGAAVTLQRLRDDSPQAALYEPELSLLLASAWRYSGNLENARKTVVDLVARGGGRVKIGGKEVPMAKSGEDPLVWLTQVLGAEKLAGENAGGEAEWRVFRGNAARNATTNGDMPLVYRDMQLRWQVPVVNDPKEEAEVTRQAKAYVDSGFPAQPALHPLAVGNLLLMRTPTKVVGVDFQTGKRIWEFPWDEAEEDTTVATQGPALQLNGMNMQGQAFSRGVQLQQRLWQDLPYGQMSSDGERVYVLKSVGFANPANMMMPQFIFRGGRPVQNSMTNTSSELAALDLKTQGKILWAVGGEETADEPKLAGAFFLGPPLPVLDQLFVLAEMNSEIRLVALEAKTGKELWSQQLAMMDRQVVFDPLRRLAGASPSFADGALICPTGNGAIVAVDLATRTLRWGCEYKKELREGNPQLMQFRRAQMYQQRQGQTTWTDNTATIARGIVVITPVDDDAKMYGVDLLTGKIKWEHERGELLFVAGVVQDRVLLVGKRQITALVLDTGAAAWKADCDLPDQAMPSGRGFLSGNYYFQPTTGRKLLKIDTTTGSIVEQVQTEAVLGNLICYKDELISQSHESVITFYQLAALRRRVAEVLKETPNDIWALSRLGELQLHDGQRAQALATLRQAYQTTAAGSVEREELETLLVTTLLAELRVNFAENERLAAEVEGLVKQPSQRAEYLRLMAGGWQRAGQRERAFETYLKLADLADDGDERMGGDDRGLDRIDAHWTVSRARWLAVRLGELLREAPADQAAKLNQAAQARLDTALGQLGPAPLRRFLSLFELYPAAQTAKLELVKRLIASGDATEAEQVLLSLDRSRAPEVAATAMALYADLLLRTGRVEESAAHYQRLAARFAQVKNLEGKTGTEILAGLPEKSPVRTMLAATQRWGGGKVEELPARQSDAARGYGQRILPVAMRRQEGPMLPGLQIGYEPSNVPAILLNNGQGQNLLRVSLSQQTPRYGGNAYVTNFSQGRGHLLVLSLGMELIAIDTLRLQDANKERVLWRQDVTRPPVATVASGLQPRVRTTTNAWGAPRIGPVDPFGKPLGGVGPVTELGVCFQKMRDIVCVDPLTGQVIWQRDNFEPGCELFGDESMLVVVPPDEKDKESDVEAVFLDPLDGRELGRRKAPRAEVRWTSVGRNLLTWTDAGEKRTLKLVDLWNEGKVIWSLETRSTSKGVLVGDDEVAILDNYGKFQVLALADGSSRLMADLQPEPKLAEIHVIRSTGQYVLMANQGPPESYGQNVTIQPAPGGYQTVLHRGRVYAFDRASGKPVWQAPAYIDSFGFPLDQPTELPVLVFLRHVTKPEKNQTRQMKTEVLCLDRRDGRAVLDRPDLKLATNFFSVKGEPAQQLVTLELPNGFLYPLKFTDEPTPPAAPLQNGEQASAEEKKGVMVRVFKPLANGLFGPLTPRPIQPFDPFDGNDPDAPAAADPFDP